MVNFFSVPSKQIYGKVKLYVFYQEDNGVCVFYTE